MDKAACPSASDTFQSTHFQNMAGYEMDAAPEHLFMNTFIDNLRSEKTRLWIKTIVLSFLLGLFAICTAVLSILYGMTPTGH